MPESVRSNLELAQMLWVGVSTGNPELLREVMAPDVRCRACGSGDLSGFFLGVDAVLDLLATAGDLSDQFHSQLYDIYASEGGAVLHYSVEVTRGRSVLETAHLLELRMRDGRICEGLVVPLDQDASARFWKRPVGRRTKALHRGAHPG